MQLITQEGRTKFRSLLDGTGINIDNVLVMNHADGSIGIGTADPDQMLSVNGDASKTGGGSWATFSDERLKNILGPFSRGIETIVELQPVRYRYRADNVLGLRDDGEHVGFSAQAVQQVLPEAVSENRDGYLMLDADPILWAMVNAVKQQHTEIASLTQQNRNLTAKVDGMMARLERLETQLNR
jgi:hypothetical protein